jgi:hypothetical protein
MVVDLTTGEVWTPGPNFVRDMYNLGRYVDDTQGERLPGTTTQGERESEFDRWLRMEKQKVWEQAINHVEPALGHEMKRAAQADNPYMNSGERQNDYTHH